MKARRNSAGLFLLSADWTVIPAQV